MPFELDSMDIHVYLRTILGYAEENDPISGS